MDKIISKILAEALAPVIALLQSIDSKLGNPQPQPQTTTPMPEALKAQIAAIEETKAIAAAVEKTLPPAPVETLKPTEISREDLGRGLVGIAKISPDKAIAILAKFGAKALGEIPVEKYPAVVKEIEAVAAELSAPKVEGNVFA